MSLSSGPSCRYHPAEKYVGYGHAKGYEENDEFPTMFDDFFNTDFMPRARSAQWDACLSKNNTAPAVNVKESEKAYTMELAAPGIKKEYCRVAINDEGNLTIAIEKGGAQRPSESLGGYQQEHKHEEKHHHYLRREFSYSNYEQTTCCLTMWFVTRFLPRWRTAS